MNNEKINPIDDDYSLHRILKTDIKKNPNDKSPAICGCNL